MQIPAQVKKLSSKPDTANVVTTYKHLKLEQAGVCTLWLLESNKVSSQPAGPDVFGMLLDSS